MKTVDPIYAAYTKSAPLLDLLFYIDHATRHEHEYSPATRAIMGAMRELAENMTAPKPRPATTAAQKREVWTLISAFKASWWGYGCVGTLQLAAEAADAKLVADATDAYELDYYTGEDEAA